MDDLGPSELEGSRQEDEMEMVGHNFEVGGEGRLLLSLGLECESENE